MLYLWIKTIHILAIIAWMVGLLYLPRLYVYHSTARKNSRQDHTFRLMEKRLLKRIMTPAMITAILAGLTLIALNPQLMTQTWLQIKLILVLALTAIHGKFSAMRKTFINGTATHTPNYYRIWNEVPTALMICIIILVIVRPF